MSNSSIAHISAPMRYQLVNTLGVAIQSELLNGTQQTLDQMPNSHLNLLVNYCSAKCMLIGATQDLNYLRVEDLPLIAVIFHSALIVNIRSADASIVLRDLQLVFNEHVRNEGFLFKDSDGVDRLTHQIFEDPESVYKDGYPDPMFCLANICSQCITGMTPNMGYILPLLEVYGLHTEQSIIKLLQGSEKFFRDLLRGYTESQAFQLLSQELNKHFKPADMAKH